MDRYEAESKLKLYHEKYGDLVYTATPQALREHARDFRTEAEDIRMAGGGEPCEASLLLLVKAVQYEAVALCRDDLGENWVSPIAPKVEVEEDQTVRSMSAFRKRQEKTIDAVEQDLEVTFTPDERSGIIASADALLRQIDDADEPEIFSMVELANAPKPRFKIGDPCWVCDWDEDNGRVIGYVPGTVVGLECYPDEVCYMIGFYDEIDGVVTTNFETVQDDSIFEEMPDEIIEPGEKQTPKKKDRSHLSVVK